MLKFCCLFSLLFCIEVQDSSCQLSFTNVFTINNDSSKIQYFYAVLADTPVTLFSKNNNRNDVIVFETLDDNGQYIRIVRDILRFDHSEFVFVVDNNRIILVSPYDFCKIYYSSSKNHIHQINSYVPLSVNLKNKSIYFYLIQLPKRIHFPMSFYTSMILGYEQSKTNPDSGIETHYWIDSPSSFFISYAYRDFYINQIINFFSSFNVSLVQKRNQAEPNFKFVFHSNQVIRNKIRFSKCQ